MADQTTLVCQTFDQETNVQKIPYWHAGARITGNEYDDYCDDEKLMKWIMKWGSAVTVVYASDHGFKNYMADTVFDTCSDKTVNHAVHVIGWGTQYGIDYWLIKNSWGDNFGDGGFIKIKRGTCGLATRCAVGTCEATGYSPSEVPEMSGYLAATPCDVSIKYPDLTGTNQWISYKVNGEPRHTRVNCAHGKCSAADPHNESNTCMILCGYKTCGYQ